MVSVFESMYNDACERLSKANIECGELTARLRTAEKDRDFWKAEYQQAAETLRVLQSTKEVQ